MQRSNVRKPRPLLSPGELEKLVEELAGDGLEEGVIGAIDAVDDQLTKLERLAKAERQRQKAIREATQPKPVTRKPRRLQELAIPKETLSAPRHAAECSNVVSLPEELLKKIGGRIDQCTEDASNFLLVDVLPLMLSFETGSKFAKAAMRDGVGIDIDFDAGLADAVKRVGILAVLDFFVTRSTISPEFKRRFMVNVSSLLASEALTSMAEGNIAKDRETLSQELQAVVYSGSSKKTTRHSRSDFEQPEPQETQPADTPAKKRVSSPVGASKRRRS